MKVLVVVDSDEIRQAITEVVEAGGHSVMSTDSASIAVKQFIADRPDMIFMDSVMLENSDAQLAMEIKAICNEDEFIPIIFLIPHDGKGEALQAIEMGGDDFLRLPIDPDRVNAKIRAMNRFRVLHSRLIQSHKALKKFSQRTQRELDVSKHVFSVILDKGESVDLPLRSWVNPVSMFNGDLVLSARTPSGGVHIMAGDFTGHGLAAALGALPTSDIFFSMTQKGFSIGDIVVEMNKRLQDLLPTDMFCAATLFELDNQKTTLGIWNGGNPDVIITKQGEGVVKTIRSFNAPLGIVDNDKFRRQVEMMQVDGDYAVFACSDGLINAMNANGERYGKDRLVAVCNRVTDSKEQYKAIIDDVTAFQGRAEQKDDITLVEVLGGSQSQISEKDENVERLQKMAPACWHVDVRFDQDVLRAVNPTPQLLNLVMQIQDPAGHRERIFTILAELYSNALDHGLLKLDSAMKNSSQGFAQYYRLKKERLEALKEGHIKISIAHESEGNAGILYIDVEDTGEGFDYSKALGELNGNRQMSGRGIGLVNGLCERLEYHGSGNHARAIYKWKFDAQGN